MRDSSVKKALAKKADQVEKTTKLLLANVSDWQVIKQYLSNRLEEDYLTDMQKEKLQRYQFMYNESMSSKYSENEILNATMRIYKIGLTQAYEDWNAMQEIFTTVLSINKRFEMKLELNSARALKRKCEEMGDMKSAAAHGKNIIALLKELEDEEENPGDMFEGHQFEAVFNPTLLGASEVNMKEVLTAINEKRGKKINIDMFEDIPYQEVKGG
jgi:hypothetical protein